MPTFRYKGYRQDGREISGQLNADNQRDARARLKNEGVLATEIGVETAGGATGRGRLFRKRTGLPELALMTRRLATLIGSSVPIYEAMTTLMEQERPGELRSVLSRVRDRLAEGSGLAAALSQETGLFSESYISMVAAGEASGALDLVLERLATFLEEQEAIRSRVTTALAYPLLMIVVGCGVMLFLLGFVIPKITVVFADNRAALPLITVALIKISTLVRKGWWLVLLLVVGSVILYRRLLRQERFILKRDRLLLRLPGLGSLLQKLVLSRFAKILGLLLGSGVPVIRAMEITAEAVVNRSYRLFLTEARSDLIEGGKLSASLAKSPLFPPLLVHMVGIGEQSGTMETMLEKAGSAFEGEFNTATTRFLSLLEPLLVLAMGLAVGFVVIAVLLPIFQLNQLVK
ncbi:MAG TPA: type II secretion system inner membrane protein GspF [Geobacteraceae bacterium]|nr:type II secretion system inner membrane protein GspF [Geobacteraceae bacterium]